MIGVHVAINALLDIHELSHVQTRTVSYMMHTMILTQRLLSLFARYQLLSGQELRRRFATQFLPGCRPVPVVP